MLSTILGLLSGILLAIAYTPYIVNAIKRRTQPQRVTWLIIFILNCVGVANQAASGAKGSLLFFIAASIISFIIFYVSLSRGVGGYAKLDIAALAGAALGLLLWWLLHSPLASIILNAIVSTIALVPTVVKAYRQPKSETKITWLIGAMSSLLATVSVGKISFALLLLPLCASLQQLAIFVLLEAREQRLAL